MKKIVFLMFLATLVGIGTVYAGGYGYNNVVDYNNAARIIIRDKVVEYDPDRFLGVEGYYRLGEHLSEKSEAEKSTKHELELELLQKQIDLLKLQMEAAAKAGAKPMPKPEVETPVEPEAPKVENTYEAVTLLFSQKCSKCHGDTKKDGGLQLIKSGALVDIGADEREKVFLRTFFPECVEKEGLAKMPKGGKALTDEEMNVVFKWQLDKSLGN